MTNQPNPWPKLLLTVVALVGSVGSTVRGEEAPPPNMVVIVVDDLRWDDLGCAGHPFVKTPNIDRLAREGAQFLNAFATTPLCSPSRACLLTGCYARHHGITDNTERSQQSHRLKTFAKPLQEAGYQTAFIGKWHMGNDDSPRPGFHHWVSLKGQGSSLDPELNINGKSVKRTGYVTDVLHEEACKFLDQPHAKPFLLYLAHKGLHPETVQRADGSLSDPNASNFVPAARHAQLYAGKKPVRRPSAAEGPIGKPALQREVAGLPPLGGQTGTSDESILGRLRMLAAIDESLGGILQILEKQQSLARTLLVFTSDHGYFYGEHGLSVERRLAYEEAIRIPLLMRYPPLIRPKSQPLAMTITLDLAPTLIELAKVRPREGMDGRSLVGLFRGDMAKWRDEFIIEHFSDDVFPRMKNMGYQAIRTRRWKLIRYRDLKGMDELYDLQSDPFERNNLISDPRAESVRASLDQRLTMLTAESPVPQ